MIVQCIHTRSYTEGIDPSLKLNQLYFVLSLIISPSEQKHKIVIQVDSHDSPILVELENFGIVDENIPAGWHIQILSSGDYCLEPKEFRGDFWDLYHDGNEEAEITFGKVLEKIKKFHTHNGPAEA